MPNVQYRQHRLLVCDPEIGRDSGGALSVTRQGLNLIPVAVGGYQGYQFQIYHPGGNCQRSVRTTVLLGVT